MDKKEKRLIIVTGPVCSGKTTVAINIAKNTENCFYFDKDDLVLLSEVVFKTAGENIDRHSDFFKKAIRDPEYDVTGRVCMRGLAFNDTVLVNAPYTSEIYDEAKGFNNGRISYLRSELDKIGGRLVIVFIRITPEILRARLLQRKSDPEAFRRDRYVYDDLEGYIAKQKIFVPDLGGDPRIDKFFVFDTENRDASYDKLMSELGIENYKPYQQNV